MKRTWALFAALIFTSSGAMAQVHIRERMTISPYSVKSAWAFLNTDSNIGLVSLPVNVFCWLGWYEDIMVMAEFK